ncbi:MAG TPA: F0F1 ATP synthase subunit B [Actinomycetota bacterium]|nr:F0F1 ATP synthase subunit B [Actinomycetota bacterium]
MHLAYLLAQEAAQGESRNPIFPATNELVWGTIAFLLLLFLMYRTVFPSINKAYKDRRANIEGKLEQAEREREEAEQLLEHYRRRLRDAEDETQRILEEARSNAERVRRDLLAKAETDAGRELDRARQAIRAERDQAIRQLRNEVGTLAVELATRVVGDSLDRDRQLRLVDEYIEELGTQAQAGAMTSRREGSGGLMDSPPVDRDGDGDRG